VRYRRADVLAEEARAPAATASATASRSAASVSTTTLASVPPQELPGRLHAVDTGHVDVQKYQLRPARPVAGNGVLAVGCDLHPADSGDTGDMGAETVAYSLRVVADHDGGQKPPTSRPPFRMHGKRRLPSLHSSPARTSGDGSGNRGRVGTRWASVDRRQA
jgi:hypothetical protein